MSTDDPNRKRRKRKILKRKPRKRKPAKLTKPPKRKNTKVTGERSEAGFLYRASNPIFNFGIAKPWGDSRRYDFILDNGRRLFRIQIKCTESLRAGAYETRATYTIGKGRAVYTKKDIDFIAAHVVPLDIWYIIPVEVCTPRPMLRFYPHRKARKMRLEQYREAWHLLQSEEDAGDSGKIELQARADDRVYPPIPPSPVILSEAKDLCSSPALSDRKKTHATPTRLPKSAAPWPIPPLRILATRKGKQILPDPESE
jgi:hypothetical protein